LNGALPPPSGEAKTFSGQNIRENSSTHLCLGNCKPNTHSEAEHAQKPRAATLVLHSLQLLLSGTSRVLDAVLVCAYCRAQSWLLSLSCPCMPLSSTESPWTAPTPAPAEPLANIHRSSCDSGTRIDRFSIPFSPATLPDQPAVCIHASPPFSPRVTCVQSPLLAHRAQPQHCLCRRLRLGCSSSSPNPHAQVTSAPPHAPPY
jgi:hypothetical protein